MNIIYLFINIKLIFKYLQIFTIAIKFEISSCRDNFDIKDKRFS